MAKPILVMSYDDGPAEDYTKTFPVHQAYGVPATFCPIIDNLVKGIGLTKAQILEMSAAGHEFCTHGYHHLSLDTISGVPYALASPVTAGDTVMTFAGIWQNAEWFAPVMPLNSLTPKGVIEEGTNKEEFTPVSRTDSTFELASPLQNSYSTGALIYHSEDTLYVQLEYARQVLESYGVPVHGIIYPGSGHSARVRNSASNYLRYARAGWHFSESNPNQPTDSDLYRLGSQEFADTRITEAEISAMMDGAVAGNKLLFLHSHSYYTFFTQSRIAFVIETAQAKGLEIKTMGQALKEFGFYVPSPHIGSKGTNLIKWHRR